MHQAEEKKPEHTAIVQPGRLFTPALDIAGHHKDTNPEKQREDRHKFKFRKDIGNHGCNIIKSFHITKGGGVKIRNKNHGKNLGQKARVLGSDLFGKVGQKGHSFGQK